MMPAHVVIAKQPVAGRVKTRLCPPLSPGEAAALACAALRDTIDAVDAAASSRKVLCFEGDPAGWLRPGWEHRRQRSGTFDVRLADALAATSGAAMVVAMDTPQLDAGLLGSFDPTRFDACVGPTRDGGYWTIGLRDTTHAPAALHGVPMSTDRTCAAQVSRLRSLGLSVQLLDELVDVDTVADAITVARLAPHTRFAGSFARLDQGAA